MERPAVRPSPLPPDASTCPEAHRIVRSTFHPLYEPPWVPRPEPYPTGTVLPIHATGDVRGGEEKKEAGSRPREHRPPRRPEPLVRRSWTRRSRARLRPLLPHLPLLRAGLHCVAGGLTVLLDVPPWLLPRGMPWCLRGQEGKVKPLGPSVRPRRRHGRVRSCVAANHVSLVFFPPPGTRTQAPPWPSRRACSSKRSKASIFRAGSSACRSRERAGHLDAPMRPRPRERHRRAANLLVPSRRVVPCLDIVCRCPAICCSFPCPSESWNRSDLVVVRFTSPP
jgi:hypothetical protein